MDKSKEFMNSRIVYDPLKPKGYSADAVRCYIDHMLRALLLTLFAVPALILFSLGAHRASAQQGGSLAGQWKMVSSTPEGNEIPWTLTIRYKDGSYSASMSTGQGEEEPRNFKVDGNNISMGVNYEGDEYEIKLKYSGDKLVGTWSGNGNSGDTKGERTSTAS